MGSDPAPYFANLFLYYYENEWLNKLKKSDLHKARQFSNTFRFIDDLGALNDGGLFDFYRNEIYPPEMELGKENDGTLSASFLDLFITVVGNKFNTKLFDKRDSFPFQISRMPFLCSNIPSKVFYSSLGAEILRIGRATSQAPDFYQSGKAVVDRMVRQGGKLNRIKKTLTSFYAKHQSCFSNFATSSEHLANLLCT